MQPWEMRKIEADKKAAFSQVKYYFETIIHSPKKRELFKTIAEKKFPEEFTEIQEIKDKLQSGDLDLQQSVMNINRFSHVSKVLIRKVAVELLNVS